MWFHRHKHTHAHIWGRWFTTSWIQAFHSYVAISHKCIKKLVCKGTSWRAEWMNMSPALYADDGFVYIRRFYTIHWIVLIGTYIQYELRLTAKIDFCCHLVIFRVSGDNSRRRLVLWFGFLSYEFSMKLGERPVLFLLNSRCCWCAIQWQSFFVVTQSLVLQSRLGTPCPPSLSVERLIIFLSDLRSWLILDIVCLLYLINLSR